MIPMPANCYFNDGSFWLMNCTSAGTEWDAGTMYPTQIEDSNGNQIFINYADGVGVTWANSSSRISTIEDVRGNGSPDYTFTYNMDPIPHLTAITNSIATAEKYSFGYTENYALDDPFAAQNFGTVALLASSAATSIPSVPLTTYFSYDTTTATSGCSMPSPGTSGPGQLTQVTTPYCGHLRYSYHSHALSGSRSFYEIQYRYLSMYSGATETSIQLSRGNDTSYTVQQSGTLDDSTANARKIWNFQTNTSQFNLGLVTQYSEKTLSPLTTLSQLTYAWSQTPNSLNPYISSTTTKLDPGQTYEADKQTTQTLDQYGNVSLMQVFNFGAGSVGSLARTYNNSYLYQNSTVGTHYTPLYIFNRLQTSTATDGTNTAALVSNTYDAGTIGSVTGSLYEHDASYSTAFAYRGNVTNSVVPITTTANSFDLTGNVTGTTVNGVTSTVTASNNDAAPEQISVNTQNNNNLLLQSTMTWSAFLGLSSAAGPNGDAGSVDYDSNARPSSTKSPYGAVTTYIYNDAASTPNKVAITDGHWVQTNMDGFGRAINTITGYSGTGYQTTGSTAVSFADTVYAPCGCSPLGKLNQQSQPYAPGATEVYTVHNYDASGRTTSVVLPDGSTTTYTYKGNTVQVTDPAGNSKTFTMDAFGNLVTVQETDPTLGAVTTSYTYDILNHLITVSMPRGTYGTQTRTFNYNTGTPATTVTGFLQSATNPENATVTYSYNSNHTLHSKTDAKNQTLTYYYDAINRLISVKWPGAPGGTQTLRTYYYDINPLPGYSGINALGRLAMVQYALIGSGTIQLYESYGYGAPNTTGAGLPYQKELRADQLIASGFPCTPSAIVSGFLDTYYYYNDEGQLTSLWSPNTVDYNPPDTTRGPIYNYSYDSMNRLSGMTMTDSYNNNTTIVSGVGYNVANQLTGVTFNNIAESRQYNSLGQLTNLQDALATSPYTPYENRGYNYPTDATNNGKISSMSDAISGETVTYTYDSLNRLETASSTIQPTLQWDQSYVFDPFGNLLQKNIAGGLPGQPSTQVSVDTTHNWLSSVSGLSYDANGNTLTSGLTYDVENHMAADEYYVYAYDTQNQRIATIEDDGADSCGNIETFTLSMYSPTGQNLGNYRLANQNYPQWMNPWWMQVQLSSGDQYFGGRRLAAMDQLGSAGNYFPWGEDKGGTSPQDTWNFGTYWRDSSTGLDYAKQRYYSNAYGRFSTPDPYTNSGRSNDPQSWNRYAYTRGDPVNRFDPRGRDDCAAQFADASQPYDPNSSCSGPVGSPCPNLDMITAFQDSPDAATFYAQAAAMGCTSASATEIAQGGDGQPWDDPFPDLDCTIELFERPTPSGGPAKGWGRHTYIYINDGDYSYGGAALPGIMLEGGPVNGKLTGFISAPGQGLAAGKWNASNPFLASNQEVGGEFSGPQACGDIISLLNAVNNYDSGPKVPYAFLGTTNSNAFTYTLLSDIGLSTFFGHPSGFTPGWGQTITGLTVP